MSTLTMVTGWDMLHLNAQRFCRVIQMLAVMRTGIDIILANDADALTGGRVAVASDFSADLAAVRDDLLAMELPMTARSFERLIALHTFPAAPPGPPQLLPYRTYSAQEEARLLTEINGRFLDELAEQQFLVLNAHETTELKTGSDWVSMRARDIFPSIIEEAESASNAMAFGLYTACVFHLMRIMETAVRAVARRFQIEKVDQPWGPLLTSISRQVEALPKSDEKTAWSQSNALLFHVKNAWRNETMHPKKTYTLEEARSIKVAVTSYVDHLASILQVPATADVA